MEERQLAVSMGPTWPEKFVVIGAVLAAFGPYLTGSVRTEQAFVYGVTVLTIPFFARLRVPRGGRVAFMAMLLLFVVAALGAWLTTSGVDPMPPGRALAGLDNFVCRSPS